MVPCSGFGGRGAVFIVDAREADGGIEGHTVPLRFGGREHAPPTKTRCFCGWWENLGKKGTGEFGGDVAVSAGGE